jgi:predicted nucleic acid-binding protein
MLIDTDILIDTGRSVSDATAFLQRVEQSTQLSISSITQMELMVGARNKNELRVIEKFLKRFVVIKVSEAISDVAVDLVRQYRLSHGLLIPDALIAATAIVGNQPLATKNRRDYQFIVGLTLSPYP